MSPDSADPGGPKFISLISCLKEAGGGLLAFSGGVDSAFLLRAMQVAGIRTLAVTAVSDTMPAWDFDNAVAIAKDAGVEHMIIKTEELSKEEFARNSPDRCFYCKDELFGRLRKIADERGLGHVFDGSNADDLNDYRPGRRAAELHQVMSPLAECGFSKNEIRNKSKEFGLVTWDRPSSPCLSSRFPYGRRITPDLLKKVEAAEAFLRTLGLRDVRVRDCGDTARIEVGESEMTVFMDAEARRIVSGRLKSLGYKFISLDLDGYKSGSLNRVLAGHNI